MSFSACSPPWCFLARWRCSGLQQQMVKIQKKAEARAKAAATQTATRKRVLKEALTPYHLAVASRLPTTMTDMAVASEAAAQVAAAATPATSQVRHDQARLQLAKMPKKSSTPRVM